MKITFLGTSHGVPEANRRCSCTMVEVSGRYYFVDMGMMALNDLITRGIKVDAVQGVFVTHMHGDHTNGLVGFADLLRWYFKKADPVMFLPKVEGAKILKNWFELVGTNQRDLRFQEVQPGIIFDDGFLKVTAIPTQHCEKSYAYLLEAEGKAVIFTGDLKRPGEDFPEVAKEIETALIVCEAAHFPATEYAPLLAQCKTKQVVVNHWGAWSVPHIQQLAKEMQDLPVLMANDNMEVTV